MTEKKKKTKKSQLPEEIQKLVDEVQQQEEAELHQIIVEQKKKRKGEWDVKINDPIPYFDSNLSYELTGYKPIDKTHGLDFDPDWFREAAITKQTTGHYC